MSGAVEEDDDIHKIRSANLVIDQISQCSINLNISINDQMLTLISCKAHNLTDKMKEEIFTLFQDNMKSQYESNWGWEKEGKWKEIFSPNSHFIILMSTSDVVAFVNYQFCWDDEDEPEYAVLFCYELQVHSHYRRHGIGYQLMNMLSTISAYWKMKKTMLTCFKSNSNALKFYNSIGYKIDRNSPSNWGHNCDYEILSDKPNL